MLFNSLDFLLFFPAVTLVFFLIPSRLRYLWLLGASYYFYMCWSPRYALLMLFSTAVTWLGGRCIAASASPGVRKAALWLTAAANLGVLGLFKYFNFFSHSLELLSGLLGLGLRLPRVDLLLPVGISFYTFQALGYTIDVYRGDVEAEKNPLRYALFVSFFPQLVAGPIERSGSLLRQLRAEQRFDAVRARAGLVRMGWGLFQKMVVADRLAFFVDAVYNDPAGKPGSAAALATALFMFQIYCDFGGYSNIAIGAAQVMGVTLMENFRQPFLAHSVKEFWDRWHISLSTWFRDYLYIPLGGSRKGTLRAAWNTLIVFFVSGLWHGAAWHYVFWGGIHGVFLALGRLLRPARQRLDAALRVPKDAPLVRGLSLAATLFLVGLTFPVFRANSMSDLFVLLRAMVTDFRLSALAGDGLFAYGLDQKDFAVALIALAVLIVHDLLSERGNVLAALERQALPLRWTAYLLLAFAILIFGVYGPEYDAAAFIYFEF